MAFSFNRMFKLLALQDQRLQLPELLTCQTGYFGDVCLQCPFGIHMSTAQLNTCAHTIWQVSPVTSRTFFQV